MMYEKKRLPLRETGVNFFGRFESDGTVSALERYKKFFVRSRV